MNLRLNFLIDETKADPDRSYSLHWTNWITVASLVYSYFEKFLIININ